MLAIEVKNIVNLLIDESATPYEGEADLSRRYNRARLVWQSFHYSRFELSEISRAHLRPFLGEENIGEKSMFYHSDVAKNVRFINAILGDFTFECNGIQTERTLPIPKKEVSLAFESLQDPNSQPTDTDPYCIDSGDSHGSFTKILSTNTPKNVQVFFVKRPTDIDLVKNPNQELSESDESVHEIVNFLLKSKAYTVDDFNKFQATNQIEKV